MPKVSVVIPCFNQGSYLEEAVDSVLGQTLQDVEVIVVNDGSTDPPTLNLLRNFTRPRTRVIHTVNQGLATARNTGISAACSPYILPLDADDLINPHYLERGAEVLDSADDVGIVYCLAEKFGEVNGIWNLPAFTKGRICINNPIFCSAMFRKRDWEQVGGYDPRMKYGWEDWDLWISLVKRGRRVVRIPEVQFRYRITSQSMTRSMSYWQKLSMIMQLARNHKLFFFSQLFSCLWDRSDVSGIK
jgi:glycosyltransferase involved in cell wall biosynthesis